MQHDDVHRHKPAILGVSPAAVQQQAVTRFYHHGHAAVMIILLRSLKSLFADSPIFSRDAGSISLV
jgi:hypothetical protein